MTQTYQTESQVKRELAYDAKIAQAMTQVRQYNDTVYSVPSSRAGHGRHILLVINGKVECDSKCEGYTFHGHCYHQIAVERFIAAQVAVAQAEQVIKSAEEQLTENAAITLKSGGIVRASEQVRTRARGEFSLLR